MQGNKIATVIKGLIIGATMIVPGVSGGTMAIILGIYDRLILAVSSFRIAIKDNLIFLFLFTAGAGAGAFFFASHLSWLLDSYPFPTMYFFLGAVFGGVPLIEKQAGIKRISWDVIVYILIGVGCVLLLSSIPMGVTASRDSSVLKELALLVAMGLISAIALILPGISLSHFFLVMGMYEELIAGIKGFNLGFLAPVGIGGLIGIILFSKILEWVMRKYPKQTFMIILGFILGSVAEVFPGVPEDGTFLWCAGTAVAGYWGVNRMSKME